MKLRLIALVTLASAFVFTPRAKADSITFESHTGNEYTYDLTLDHHATLFLPGGFSLTGLTGVTNVTLSGKLNKLFDIVSFSSDTVVVGTLFGASYDFKHVPYSIGTLTLTSLATPGLGDFEIFDSHGVFEGTVNAPTQAPVPEPSSLVLLGSGLLGLAGAARRKLAA